MTDNALTAVTQLTDTYIQSTYEGDVATMRAIFDDAAVMNGYIDGQLMKGTPAPFLEQLENNPSLKSQGAPYKATIESIEAHDGIGCSVIKEDGFGPLSFMTYLHMIQDGSEWKIVSKTFFGRS